MPLVHSLLSLTLAAAPSGSIAPQSRAIADGAEVLEVEPPKGANPSDEGEVETGGATSTAEAGEGASSVPHPSAGIDRADELGEVDGPAEDARFDTDPVYLGCGHLVPACENLTTVGVITGGAGIALIAGSTALLLTPDQVIADEPAYVRNYTRAGTTLLALGIGLATTGLLMVLTAARASHSRRVRRSSSRAGRTSPLALRGAR